MSRPSYSGASYLGAMVGGWVLGWFSGAVRAAVAMKGWEWFVVDTFGAPPVGFFEAWGLFLLVSFATMHVDTSTSSDRSPSELAVTGFLMSLLMSGVFFASLVILAGLR